MQAPEDGERDAAVVSSPARVRGRGDQGVPARIAFGVGSAGILPPAEELWRRRQVLRDPELAGSLDGPGDPAVGRAGGPA